MIRYLLVLLSAAALLVGCASTDTRDRAFSDDWATHNRRRPPQNRRAVEEPKAETEEQIGPVRIRRDERGRPQVGIGGDNGVGADVDYRGGPSGRLRYRRQWDFVRPERR